MNLTESIQVINIGIRIFLDGITIPQEHRKINFIKTLPSKDNIRRYMALIDKSGFSYVIKHGDRSYNFHFTKKIQNMDQEKLEH